MNLIFGGHVPVCMELPKYIQVSMAYVLFKGTIHRNLSSEVLITLTSEQTK